MPACTYQNSPCTPDPATVALNGFDPQCDPSFCSSTIAPAIGEDACAQLVGDPVSYNQCEATLYAKQTGGAPPPPLGVSPWDSIWQGYNGPTSLGDAVGRIPLSIKLPTAAILLVVAAVAFAPYLGLVEKH